jgi:hypothetical protein
MLHIEEKLSCQEKVVPIERRTVSTMNLYDIPLTHTPHEDYFQVTQ